MRCNPLSGNLHPTESYLLCPHLADLPGGVYHYLSRDHVLERRAAVGDLQWTDVFFGRGNSDRNQFNLLARSVEIRHARVALLPA